MNKFLRALTGTISYCIHRLFFYSREILVIENNIFGHAILESALLSEYVKANSQKKIFYVLHPHSANRYLTNTIIETLKILKVDESKLARRALHGEDILVNRLDFGRKIKTVKFQDELTHLTASKINEELLPKFNFRQDLSIATSDENKFIIFMNRSTAYRKFQESGILQSYRNFDFSSIDSLDIKNNSDMKFIRIGTPDGIATNNHHIIDLREKTVTDPELDIKLQSSASGYFGADSGPVWLALAMKKPVAFINMIPINHESPVESNRLVVIPKLIFSRKFDRFLTIAEMLSPEISGLKSLMQFNELELEPVSNSNQDVSDFFVDWLAMLRDSTEIVNENYMSLIRKKFDVPNLPSIHAGFVEKYPEVFGIE